MPLFVDMVAALKGRPIPQPRPNDYQWPYLSGMGQIPLVGGVTASYYQLYRSQPWVYAAVRKIGLSVARTPLKAYTGPSDNRTRVTDGPLAELLAHPYEPYGIPFRVKEQIAKSICVYGHSIVVKLGMIADDTTPRQLMPAPATNWRIGEGETYVWTSPAGDQYPFERWKIIHTQFWDCDDTGFGMSPLEPLRMALAVEDAAQRFGVSAFRNGSRPANVLTTDQTLTAATIKGLKEQLESVHKGVDNAFQTAVLQQGLTWGNPPVSNLEEAAVIEHRTLTRQEVAAVFDVPQPTIGILDEANFASIDMFHTMLYQDSIGPYFSLIEQSLQAQLIDATPAFATLGAILEFDQHGLMRGADSDQYRNYSTALAAGFMTPNEVRGLENLPASPQPEADQLHFPMNSTPGAVGASLAESTGQPDRTSPNGVAAHV